MRRQLSAGFIILVAGICAALITLTASAGATAPVLVMGAATNPTYTTVDVTGTVNPEGESGEWFFQVSSDNGASWQRKNVAGQFGEPVEGTITELTPGVTYKVRLAAYNYTEFTEVFSPEPSPEFTTEAVPAPTVTIDPVSSYTGTTAELNGSITANSPAGDPAAADVKWHFVCSPTCDTSDQGTVAAGDSEAVNATATGLQPNTPYTVTLIGENAGGPVTAGPVAFTTALLGPEAVTLPTLALPSASGPKIVLRGSVDPNNAPTEYRFEYGLTTAYGQTAPTGGHGDAGAGRRRVVSEQIEDLQPATTYHYKIVAEGPGGPSVGADMTFTTAPTPAPGCFSGCRAYEMVSPSEKNGGDIGAQNVVTQGMQAAPDGNAMIYLSRLNFGDGVASGSFWNSYRAVRDTSGGWTTKPVLPMDRSGFGLSIQATLGASTDLSRQVVSSYGGLTTEGVFTDPSNLLMVDASGSSTLMTPGQQPEGLNVPLFDGGSPDLSRVVFTDTAALTPNAPTVSAARESRGNLYGWTSTGLRLLDVLPGGAIPSQGAALGAESPKGFLDHAISTDASRVFFTVPDDGSGSCPVLIPESSLPDCPHIYLREDAFGPAPSTVEITANAGGPDAPGTYPAAFRGASADGTRAFFTSPAQLTADATTGASHGGNDLYEYRLGQGLTDLSVDHGDANGANVLGVMGVADDGKSVYFVATGQLDGNQGVAGSPNLYLHRDGEPTRFIATLAASFDDGVWDRASARGSVPLTSQVTPDGDHAVFVSGEGSLQPQGSGQRTIYEFSVDTGLTCVSCNPSGAATTQPPTLPGLSHVLLREPMGTHQGHAISDDGSRVFFESPEALVPQDTNGRIDVYVFEGGEPHLISTGRDTDNSRFIDATPSGDNVFFLTREQLSGDDVDTSKDLYDARIGGVTVPSHVVAPSCQNDECRGTTPKPPTLSSAATSNFSGPGNPPPSKPASRRAQSLKQALKACKSKHPKAKRKQCEKAAKKRFGKSRGIK